MISTRRKRVVVAALICAAALAGCQTKGADPVHPATLISGSSTETPMSSASPTSAAPATPQQAAPPASAAEPAPPAAPAPNSLPLAGVTVVVDPGHNGGNAAHAREINKPVDAGGLTKPCNTTGTENRQLTEAEFNWQLAQRVQQQLTAAGATVRLTRDSNDGVGPCIDERGKLAGKVGAQYLISLHADGAAASNHGFHVIHPGRVAGHTENIVAPSRDLAVSLRDALVQRGFSTSTYLGSDGLDQRTDLGTLNWAGVPAVMLEAGNMANSADAQLLASDKGQDAIASAIVAAITAQHGR